LKEARKTGHGGRLEKGENKTQGGEDMTGKKKKERPEGQRTAGGRGRTLVSIPK